jgi:magnesium transporter
MVQGRAASTYALCKRSGYSLNGSVHQLSIFLFFFRPVKVCCFDGNFLYLILQRVYTGMVAVTGRTCYDRIRIFEVKRYFLIDITESRGQIMQKNYVQEILNIIHGNIPQAELAEKLSDYHEKDLADALEALMPAERKSLYPILGVDEVAEIFAYLDDAEPYLKELSRDEAAKVISNMDSDDAADALEDLDEIDKGEIVNKLDRDSIEDVKMLLSYSEDEIGSKMTTNYIRIKNDMTIRQAMSELVKQAGENDNISVLYVVDENEHFYGAIDLKDLIIARAEDPLAELIVGSYPYVTDREKISDCIERIVDYAERSLPVLNEAGKLMGIITSSDVVELVDDEMSDDYAKLGGLTGEEDLRESVFESVKKRLPWLTALLFLGMLVSSVVGAFESVVAVLPVVICFQSMVLDMAGNVGTQSLAVTIRVLVDENLTVSKKFQLLWKEVRVGLLNGTILAVMALSFLGCYIHFFKGYAWNTALLLSGCVGASLVVAMVVSSLVGTLVPMLFHKIHIDPAVASGPLITTINDLVAVVVYYGLAMVVLIDLFHLA